MPFESKAQWRRFGAMLKRGDITQKSFDEWEGSSPPYHSLPERVGGRNNPMATKKKSNRKPMTAAQKKAFRERMEKGREKAAKKKGKKNPAKKASKKRPARKITKKGATKKRTTKKSDVRKTARRAYKGNPKPAKSKKELEAASRARRKAGDLRELGTAFGKAVAAGDLSTANKLKRKIETKDKLTGVYGHCSASCLTAYEKLKKRGGGSTAKERAIVKKLGGRR